MIAKNTFKKIGHSFGRFMSLVMIILLGVGFYAGIRQSAPAIRDAENSFVRSQNMMDLHIVSTLGLTDDDIDELNKLSTVEMATGGYSKDRKQILYFIVNHFQINKLKKIVLDIDPKAFISLQDVSDIIQKRPY